MSLEAVATARQRATSVFARKPSAGLRDDSPAVTRWTGGMRCVSVHPTGREVTTDMPSEMGGTGDEVTPGWLFRAGLASCAATTYAAFAASEGIELTLIEVRVESRSDARGFLGMTEADGRPISPAPRALRMHVRIAARGLEPESLRALVERAHRCSPVPAAIGAGTPLALEIEIA